MKNILNFYSWLSESQERNDFYKNELNSSFWSKSNEDIPDDAGAEYYTFDQELRKKLLKIAEDFYKALKFEAPIEDIQLTGSLANYNWTDLATILLLETHSADSKQSELQIIRPTEHTLIIKTQ